MTNLEPIYLNIYDLHNINNFLSPFGLGAFHTGIEIYGTEYSFYMNTGIFGSIPKSVNNLNLRRTICLGYTDKSISEVYNIIITLKEDYTDFNYNMLNNNCNDFCDSFSMALIKQHIPRFINRLAHIGNFFNCFIPKRLISTQRIEYHKIEQNEDHDIEMGKIDDEFDGQTFYDIKLD